LSAECRVDDLVEHPSVGFEANRACFVEIVEVPADQFADA